MNGVSGGNSPPFSVPGTRRFVRFGCFQVRPSLHPRPSSPLEGSEPGQIVTQQTTDARRSRTFVASGNGRCHRGSGATGSPWSNLLQVFHFDQSAARSREGSVDSKSYHSANESIPEANAVRRAHGRARNASEFRQTWGLFFGEGQATENKLLPDPPPSIKPVLHAQAGDSLEVH